MENFWRIDGNFNELLSSDTSKSIENLILRLIEVVRRTKMRIDNLAKWIETTCASTLRIIEIRIRNRYTHSISIQLIVTKPILKTRWRETTEEGRKERERVNRWNRVQAETSSGSDQSECRSILRAGDRSVIIPFLSR